MCCRENSATQLKCQASNTGQKHQILKYHDTSKHYLDTKIRLHKKTHDCKTNTLNTLLRV